MKHFSFNNKDYSAALIDDELYVFETGTYNQIPLSDKPKLAEMAANAVGGGGVDMAVNAGERRMRDKVVRRWIDDWSAKNR
jgi:hypothetical protein